MDPRRHSDVLRELLDLPGRRVLDIGCGDGSLVRFFAKTGAHATGVDISAEVLARARTAKPVADETFTEARGEALPFPDASFDIVVYFNALHHVPVAVQAAALREAARVLIPGGMLLVVEPLAEGPNFKLVQPIDDETEVRAAAKRALDHLPPALLKHHRQLIYDATVRYPDFETFLARTRAVDAARAPAIDARRAILQNLFTELGRPASEGVEFSQPTRADLLVKPQP
jgi:ubiquinone/menaquinone biosynthesis C-methylase UbiE